MKNSFVPLARRFALAGAVPIAATLAFASTAFASEGHPCPPPVVIPECHGAELVLHVGVADVGDYQGKLGTTTLEKGGKKVKTLTWASPETNRGELAKFTTKRSKEIVKVVVRDLEGHELAEATLSLNDDCELEPSPHPSPSTSPSPHPSVSPSISPRPSASASPRPSASPSLRPSPSATPTSGQPGLPKTGWAAE